MFAGDIDLLVICQAVADAATDVGADDHIAAFNGFLNQFEVVVAELTVATAANENQARIFFPRHDVDRCEQIPGGQFIVHGAILHAL